MEDCDGCVFRCTYKDYILLINYSIIAGYVLFCAMYPEFVTVSTYSITKLSGAVQTVGRARNFRA